MDEKRDHPVLYGLAALVGVGLAVGLIAGIAAALGSHVLGLGGDDGSAKSTVRESMYLPKPQKTTAATGPTITLSNQPTQSSSGPSKPVKNPKPRHRISLQAGETSVAPMGRIDLTGVYPGGEGAVLNVQKFSNGTWQDFYSISATVTNSTFATYVQTGTPGVVKFRVVDSDTQKASNAVSVTIR